VAELRTILDREPEVRQQIRGENNNQKPVKKRV